MLLSWEFTEELHLIFLSACYHSTPRINMALTSLPAKLLSRLSVAITSGWRVQVAAQITARNEEPTINLRLPAAGWCCPCSCTLMHVPQFRGEFMPIICPGAPAAVGGKAGENPSAHAKLSVTSILANSFADSANCSPRRQIPGNELPRNSISWSISRCRRSKYFRPGNACHWHVDVAGVDPFFNPSAPASHRMSRFMAASASLSLANSVNVCFESSGHVARMSSAILLQFLCALLCTRMATSTKLTDPALYIGRPLYLGGEYIVWRTLIKLHFWTNTAMTTGYLHFVSHSGHTFLFDLTSPLNHRPGILLEHCCLATWKNFRPLNWAAFFQFDAGIK